MVAYAELHCHSNFSFLDGASYPEGLVAEASELGLSALALTDHDGLYGVVRFAEAAAEAGVRTVFGSELTLAGPAPARSRTARPRRPATGEVPGSAPAAARTGVPDPPGAHLVVLARDPAGYSGLARAISEGHLAGGEKGRPRHDLDRLAELAGGHFAVLTGCRKGSVPAALVDGGPAAAGRELDRLVERFGSAHVFVELFDHDDPLDTARNDALAALAVAPGSTSSPRTSCTTPCRASAGSPRSSPPSAPGGRSTTSTGGCRPPGRPTCARRPSSTAASPATPVRWSVPPSSARRARSTSTSSPRSCPTSPCPRARAR